MVLLSLLLTTIVIAGLGAVIVRVLGWPTSAAGVMRWCYALLTCAVIFCGLPELLHVAAQAAPPLPHVDLAELLPVLLMLGLAVLGYVGWTRGADARTEQARRDAQAAVQVRRRAIPLPPTETEPDEPPVPTGFRARGRVDAPAATRGEPEA